MLRSALPAFGKQGVGAQACGDEAEPAATEWTQSSISASTQTAHFGPSERDFGNLPSLIRW